MLTVPEAARKIGKHPATVRRWIRSGRLTARQVGTHHVIEESQLAALLEDEELPGPKAWQRMPNVIRAIRLSRRGR